jgi:hypothetical protein
VETPEMSERFLSSRGAKCQPGACRAGSKNKSLLFLKKKKQKDFYAWYSCTLRGQRPRQVKLREHKSLFASFSSEKEDS